VAALSLETVLNLLYLASFALFFGYGQRIQAFVMLANVRRKLGRLESLRDSAHRRLLDLVLHETNRLDGERVIDRLTSSFVIGPVDLDPAGIVGKLQHVLDTYEDHLKSEVRRLVAGASETEVDNLTNLLEVSISLDAMYRVVRHYYLQSKRQGGLLALAQLQMSLPTIMEEAEAYNSAVDAFAAGKPIGDGVGPLVAKQFSEQSKPNELFKDTEVYESSFEGRRLLVVKAKGPGGNVGKPGLAVEKLIQEAGPIHRIITVDAAGKLEGERSGAIAEGVGAAIGGPGAERYHVEEAATKHEIPLNAVVVKMSSKEAVSVMTPGMREAATEAARHVRSIILTDTKPGDSVIVAGIGNTVGIE
jgi:hypothetical protein